MILEETVAQLKLRLRIARQMMSETKNDAFFAPKDDPRLAVKERPTLPQACEMLAVIFFTGGLILLYSRPYWLARYVPLWLALLLLFAAALTLFICAVMFTYK